MKVIIKIKSLLKRVLSISYNEDYLLSLQFIDNREFFKLQMLIDSIISKENAMKKKDRIINYPLLIQAKEIIDEYVKQLE